MCFSPLARTKKASRRVGEIVPSAPTDPKQLGAVRLRPIGGVGGELVFMSARKTKKKSYSFQGLSSLLPPLQGLESVRNRLFTLTSLFRPGAPSFLPPHILPAHTHHPRRGSCEKCIPNPTPRPTLTPVSAFAAPLIGESLPELLDLRR